ncbi:MAG: glycogen debranching N-terminal domain-containing protein [Acidimicrobiales bacterium]
MTNPWTYAGRVASLGGGGSVTLVDESTFAISDQAGDIVPGGAHGLFVRDTRVISRLELRIDGRRLEGLAAVDPDPFSATFVSRGHPAANRSDSTLLVRRTRYVGQGMREDLELRNYGPEPSVCTIEGFIDADFADLFAVKEGRAGTDPRGDHPVGGGRHAHHLLPPRLDQSRGPAALHLPGRHGRRRPGPGVGVPHHRGPRVGRRGGAVEGQLVGVHGSGAHHRLLPHPSPLPMRGAGGAGHAL